MHNVRRSMLNVIAQAIYLGNGEVPDVPDGDWLRHASGDQELLAAAENAVDRILDLAPEIEASHATVLRERYVPSFPLMDEESYVFHKAAQIIRDAMLSMDADCLVTAARFVKALEVLPRASNDVALEVTFSQRMNEGGRGWASLYLSGSELRLHQGEYVYGEYGGDHHRGPSFQCMVNKRKSYGDAEAWLAHLSTAGLCETLSFEDIGL